MTFLNSAILFGLAAVTLPLLIHFFTRSKLRTIRFSSLTFLKELRQQKIRTVKLRQILLLIIRTLIVLCLILAFARPTLKGSISAGHRSNIKTSAVLILDNSYSMARVNGGRWLFDYAKKKATDIIAVMKDGDEVFLLPTSEIGKSQPLTAFHDMDAVQKRVEEVELKFAVANVSKALSHARQLLTSSNNLNREIYLVSDLQAIDFEATTDSTNTEWDESTKLMYLPVGSQKLSNLGIENLELVSRILEKGKIAELEVSVRNYGSQLERNKLVQLFVNGKRMAQTTVSLNQAASTTEKFRFMLERSGFSTGYVLIEDDDLTADDRRDFVFVVPEKINTLLIGSETADTEVIAYALQPTNDPNSVFNITQGDLRILKASQIQEADVIILSNVPSLDMQQISMLRSFVDRGGGLVFFLGQSVDLRAYNGDLRKELGLPLLTKTMGKMGRNAPSFSWGRLDYEHPIFAGVFEQDRHPESPMFHFAVKVQEEKGIEKIIDYSNGHPMLFEKRKGQGSILFFTTAVSPDWSDMWRRSVFAPLMNRCVMYLSSRSVKADHNLLIGKEIRYALQPGTLSQQIEMELPDATRERVQPTLSGQAQWIFFANTYLPGIYTLWAGQERLGVWAVNVDARESDLSEIDNKVLEQSYNAIRISENEDISALVHARRFGRELWKYFVIAALVLLVVEMIIYREKGEVVDEQSLA